MAFRLTTTEAIEAEAAAIKTKLRPHNNAIALVFQENGFANVIASIDTIPNSPYIAIQNNDQAVCYNFSDVPSFVLPHAPITRYDFSNSPSIKLNTLNLAADYDMQTAISEVRLPANITELPPDCFAYCWSLSNINLENITKLGARAIRDCSNLDMSENFPPALEEIGADAVGSCQYSSENLELPTTLNTIHQYAFDNINGVKKVWLHHCDTIEGTAFGYNSDDLVIYCEDDGPPSGWSPDWDSKHVGGGDPRVTVVWGQKTRPW